jgi:DHA1 family multidrug resistance protein-like MFS transporter
LLLWRGTKGSMGRKAFAILLGGMFVSMLGMNIIAPILPAYAVTMGASSLELGTVQAAFSAAGIITLLFVGRLSDRLGRKPFLNSGLALLVLASAGLMFASQPLHLILLRFVQGLGASAYLSISQAYMGDGVQSGTEGRWLGHFNAVLFAGMGAGPLVGGLIKDAFGIGATFLALAVLNLLGLTAVFLLIKELPHKTAAQEHSWFLAPLKNPTMRGVFSYRLTVGLGTATLMAFIPLFAGLKLGLSASLIGVVLGARIPISMTQSITGRMADFWNRRLLVVSGGMISAAAAFFMPLTAGFWTLLFAYLAVTVGQALGIPAANAYVVQEGRTYGMGTSIATFMLAMYAGNSVGPVALGFIADLFGLKATFYAASACMAAGVAVFAWKVRNSPHESQSM